MVRYREVLDSLIPPGELDPASEAMQEWILDQLIQNVTIPVDAERLSAEIARLEAYDSHLLQQEILESGNYGLLLPENREKRSARIHQEAEREWKIDALLHFMAEQERISVSAEERERDAMRIAKEEQISLEEVRRFMGPSFEMLQGDLVLRKTLRWLCTYVNGKQQAMSACL